MVRTNLVRASLTLSTPRPIGPTSSPKRRWWRYGGRTRATREIRAPTLQQLKGPLRADVADREEVELAFSQYVDHCYRTGRLPMPKPRPTIMNYGEHL